jgi:hypothetical protein
MPDASSRSAPEPGADEAALPQAGAPTPMLERLVRGPAVNRYRLR